MSQDDMSKTGDTSSAPVRLEVRGDIGVIIVDHPPVNALSHAVRDGLVKAVHAANANPAIRAIVLACAGKTFIAGADIREFGQMPRPPLLPEVVATIEASPKSVVAALHGAALGGGLEVALGCHARIAAKDASFGLPEVKLGIIPGAGGTQRLPRLIGLDAALDLVASGRSIATAEALKLGLIDRIADDLEREAEQLARSLADQPPRRTGALSVPTYDSTQFAAARAEIARKARGQISPLRAVEAVSLAATLPLAEGLARERAIFTELVSSTQAKALRYAFFAEREVAKMPKLAGVKPRALHHIGIIGAGTMGVGIAVACLDGGIKVTVIETSAPAAEAGEARVRATYERLVKSARLTEAQMQARLSKLAFSTDYQALATADLVIEAAFEDMGVKKAIFARLAQIAKPGAVLATNTSYLDVNEIAAASGRANDVIGLHFFSPANIMRLVEVIEGQKSAPDALATGVALAKTLGKIPVLCGVCDGFVGNRLLSLYRRVVEAAIEDGALPHEVDAALESYGFAMGPFAVNDLAGLDISLAQRRRRDAIRDPGERYASTAADELCKLGRFGQKVARGWYLYDNGKRRIDPEVNILIEQISVQKGITRREISAEDIQRFVHAALVNEGAKILAEGIVARALDIDMVMLHGYGFPRWRGGPMFEADTLGLAQILHDVEALHHNLGHGFEPAPLLIELAETGRTFASLAPNEGKLHG